MTPGGYIAHIPLKYFRDISLDLFPGKLLRGRVTSSDGKIAKIELGGAKLEAQTSRNFTKGETVTLRVTNITRQGVQLEIVDTKGQVHPQSGQMQITPQIDEKSSEMADIRNSINRLFEITSGPERATEETSLANNLKALLQAYDRYDFFFLAFPLKLEDEKSRQFELLMRKLKDEHSDEKVPTRELLFSLTTQRLGSISGRILTVGKRMRIDLTAQSKSTVDDLLNLSESIKTSLTEMGFSVTAFNVSQGEVKGPVEQQINSSVIK